MSTVDRKLPRPTTTTPMNECSSMDLPLYLTSSRMGLMRDMPTLGACLGREFTLLRTHPRATSMCMGLEEGLAAQNTRIGHATSVAG